MMEESFRLSKLPMPPSSNHQYFPLTMASRGDSEKQVARLVPTGDLKNFKKDVSERWKQQNLVAVYKCRQKLREWMLKGFFIEVETFAFFNYFDLFTKEGTPKRMDGSNRIKALHDSIAEILEIDDCWFWDTIIRKREIQGSTPWCAIQFRPVEHMNLRTMKDRGIL